MMQVHLTPNWQNILKIERRSQGTKKTEKSMLELYVMKVTRTVLRRERGSNLSDLADSYEKCPIETRL